MIAQTVSSLDSSTYAVKYYPISKNKASKTLPRWIKKVNKKVVTARVQDVGWYAKKVLDKFPEYRAGKLGLGPYEAFGWTYISGQLFIISSKFKSYRSIMNLTCSNEKVSNKFMEIFEEQGRSETHTY